MDRIANSEEHLVWGGFIHTDIQEAVSSIGVILDGNAVRFSVGELSHLQVKIVDVLFGPFDL
jgi:hypothetical protein